ncbi:bromodomain-containing protein bet-1-like isoform X2 [Venturia canescens]|uniref:bromodomain-containing protein bet-1-like isoform X2 n=1 Tax=Venturia canescens TaxID=32260 RepID=UPI001C9C3DFA|nr:bromodomain-containing protein bet-1-like isoform X2 [Venturia canescens]
MMSASAVKSSMPGVGNSPPTTAHSILPMNVMAQKVSAAGNESAGMKPLGGGGLSYVTLQPANQPLSLVQDHRPAYPNPSYASNNPEKDKEKETDGDKIVQNGVEPLKTPGESEPQSTLHGPPVTPPVSSPALIAVPVIPSPQTKQQTDANRNNNQSPENPPQDKQDSNKDKSESESNTEKVESPVAASVCTPGQNKAEEKKLTPVKNGSKPESTVATVVHPPTKVSPHKPEEQQPQIRSAEFGPTKVKSSVPAPVTIPSSKPNVENSTSPATPKVEQKITSTPRNVKRKSRELKDLKGASADDGSKPKRNRVQTQPYQSPLPEIALIVKTLNKTPSTKNPDDKLIVFYKNEFLAVRNAEGSFYVCQAMQNIYKSSRRIRIRWLSQDKNNGEIYSPDFYDITDFDCILTNLNLNKIDKNKYQLTKFELLRTENILKRAIDVEAGVSEKPSVTEEHPDGLDLSLYKDESQLKRRKRAAKEKQRLRKRSKRESSSSEESSSSDEDEDDDDEDEDDDDEETDKKSSLKTSRAKKRSTNKALAIAKSVAKGPSREKRALNRAAASKTPVPVIGNNVSSSSTETAKRNPPDPNKKIEPKKIINKPQTSTIASGPSRTTKHRGSTQIAQEISSTSIAGRAKRLASTGQAATPVIVATSSTEDVSSRKKPRTAARA